MPPSALALAAGLGLALLAVLAWRAPLRFALLTWALAPLALEWPLPGGHLLSLPLEPMLAVGLATGLLRRRPREWLELARADPAFSLALAGWLGFTWVSASASVAPLVSVKSALLRSLYALALFPAGLELARRRQPLEPFLAYLAGLLPVMALTFVRHAAQAFDRDAAYTAAQPFYSNRIDLMAVLALAAPLAVAAWRSAPAARPLLASLLSGTAILSLSLSARSAWLAWAAALPVLVLALTRRRPAAVLAWCGLGALAVVLAGADLLAYRAAQAARPAPAARSSVLDALLETAVLRDESAAERANRWSCALRMGAEQPTLGFGPNTFELVYGRFQRPAETTRISTWEGDRGDAHSELATALAEQGWPGLLALLALLAAGLRAALRAHARARDAQSQLLALALVATLSAWVALNAVNSFADHEKVAPLYWLAVSLAVSLGGAARGLNPAARGAARDAAAAPRGDVATTPGSC